MTPQYPDSAQRKSRVLMVCAHEPTVDPRVSWAARSASGEFDVTVLGFAEEGRGHSDAQAAGAYQTVRLQRTSVGVVRYLWRMKDAAPVPTSVGLALLIALGAPILILAEASLSLAGWAMRMRHAAAVPSASIPYAQGANGTSSPGPARDRWSLLRRIRFIFATMRSQFAPAADVFGSWIDGTADKPDVVHCNDMDTLLVGILAKKRFGCRVVYDAHEFLPQSDSEAHWLEVKLLTALERFLARKADAVVTVNPMLAEVMRSTYDLPRVHAVPNAEWWVEPRERPALTSRMTTAAQGRIKVLFQGRFAGGRGVEEIIEGWTRVDGSKAALFLRGPDNSWRQAAIDLARRLELLDKSVYFLDPVAEDMLVPAAAEADIGVIPYRPFITNNRFACPNKLSQYLHAGLMIVANNLPYVNSVIQAAGAGLSYDSSDPSSFAGAIGRIVADPDLVRRCRENAMRYAKETFNWQSHCETLNALYRRPSPTMARSPSRIAAECV